MTPGGAFARQISVGLLRITGRARRCRIRPGGWEPGGLPGAAALGQKAALQELDLYLDLDPGAMSPYQHGEVFLTEDVPETDLDLGDYRRLTAEDLTAAPSLAAWNVRWSVLNQERD